MALTHQKQIGMAAQGLTLQLPVTCHHREVSQRVEKPEGARRLLLTVKAEFVTDKLPSFWARATNRACLLYLQISLVSF